MDDNGEMSAFLGDTWAALHHVRPAWAAVAVALYAVSVLMVAARWRLVLRALGGRPGLGELSLTHLAAICVNNVTPASRLSGEAVRVGVVTRRGLAPVTQATASVVIDRLSEVPPVVALFLIALPAVGASLPPVSPRAMLAVGGGLLLLVGVVAWRKPGLERLRAVGRSVTIPRSQFLVAVGWSAALWVQDVLRLMAAAASCGVLLTPPRAALLAATAIVTGLVPSIGGLGVVEGGMVGALMMSGVDGPTAAAITAVERAISYGLATLAGGGALVALGGRALWTTAPARDVVARSAGE